MNGYTKQLATALIVQIALFSSEEHLTYAHGTLDEDTLRVPLSRLSAHAASTRPMAQPIKSWRVNKTSRPKIKAFATSGNFTSPPNSGYRSYWESNGVSILSGYADLKPVYREQSGSHPPAKVALSAQRSLTRQPLSPRLPSKSGTGLKTNEHLTPSKAEQKVEPSNATFETVAAKDALHSESSVATPPVSAVADAYKRPEKEEPVTELASRPPLESTGQPTLELSISDSVSSDETISPRATTEFDYKKYWDRHRGDILLELASLNRESTELVDSLTPTEVGKWTLEKNATEIEALCIANSQQLSVWPYQKTDSDQPSLCYWPLPSDFCARVYLENNASVADRIINPGEHLSRVTLECLAAEDALRRGHRVNTRLIPDLPENFNWRIWKGVVQGLASSPDSTEYSPVQRSKRPHTNGHAAQKVLRTMRHRRCSSETGLPPSSEKRSTYTDPSRPSYVAKKTNQHKDTRKSGFRKGHALQRRIADLRNGQALKSPIQRNISLPTTTLTNLKSAQSQPLSPTNGPKRYMSQGSLAAPSSYVSGYHLEDLATEPSYKDLKSDSGKAQLVQVALDYSEHYLKWSKELGLRRPFLLFLSSELDSEVYFDLEDVQTSFNNNWGSQRWSKEKKLAWASADFFLRLHKWDPSSGNESDEPRGFPLPRGWSTSTILNLNKGVEAEAEHLFPTSAPSQERNRAVWVQHAAYTRALEENWRFADVPSGFNEHRLLELHPTIEPLIMVDFAGDAWEKLDKNTQDLFVRAKVQDYYVDRGVKDGLRYTDVPEGFAFPTWADRTHYLNQAECLKTLSEGLGEEELSILVNQHFFSDVVRSPDGPGHFTLVNVPETFSVPTGFDQEAHTNQHSEFERFLESLGHISDSLRTSLFRQHYFTTLTQDN